MTAVADKQYKVVNGTSYDARTPDEVIRVLENARQSGKRVRVFYGDTATGRDWMEENDVMGTIGRSTGTNKIPLLIANARSMGGGAILDHCIVRITIDKKDVYRHPSYHIGDITIRDITDRRLLSRGYTVAVDVNGDNRANFKTRERAESYVKFIKGESNRNAY